MHGGAVPGVESVARGAGCQKKTAEQCTCPRRFCRECCHRGPVLTRRARGPGPAMATLPQRTISGTDRAAGLRWGGKDRTSAKKASASGLYKLLALAIFSREGKFGAPAPFKITLWISRSSRSREGAGPAMAPEGRGGGTGDVEGPGGRGGRSHETLTMDLGVTGPSPFSARPSLV